MKHPLYLICSLLLLLTAVNVRAQLYIDAGADVIICKGDSVTLGGPDTVGGQAPYTYHWAPATGLSSTSIHNPIASPLTTTTYYLTSSDDTGLVRVDSVKVTVRLLTAKIIASDTTPCEGQTIQLSTSLAFNGCLTGTCTGSYNLSPVLGAGQLIQSGNNNQGPTLFGNFVRSNRSQMLYKASELQAVLGGAQVIRTVNFNVAIFNSNAFLQNFTIRMGCTDMDSLTNWVDNLVTVYTSPTPYQPQAGWSGIALTTPFYWDGTSDLIIDVCHFNPQTFGNINNKAGCTQTPFASYLHSQGNVSQCAGNTVPTVYNLRPNIRFNYCNPGASVFPISPYTYSWSATPGMPVSNNSSYSLSPVIDTSGYYYLQVTDGIGCVAFDTVQIQVDVADADVSSIGFERSCAGTPNGVITASFTSLLDSIGYMLFPANYSDTIYAGYATPDSSYVFLNLVNGNYHLVLTDFECKKEYPVTIEAYPPSSGISFDDLRSPLCSGDSSGHACINVFFGTPPYTYLWDSVALQPACFNGLTTGLHYVAIIDANGCSTESPLVNIPEADVPTFIFDNIRGTNCLDDSSGQACVSVTIGTPPLIYLWDSVNLQSACVDDLTAGEHFVVVIDANGCSNVSPLINIPATDMPTINFSNVRGVNCLGDSTGYACVNMGTGGTPPFTYLWDSVSFQSACSDRLTLGPHFVVVIDANGCSAQTPTVNIPSTEIPFIYFNAIQNIDCHGDSTGGACVNISSGGVPPFRFYWDSVDFQGACNFGLTAGTHFVAIIDSFGCAKKSPLFDISKPANPFIVSTNQNYLDVEVDISGGEAPYNVNWGDGSILNTNLFISTHTYASAGTYLVVITDMQGCVISNTVVIGYNSIDQYSYWSRLSIYPNPATDKLYIQASGIAVTGITIYNTLGEVVMAEQLPVSNLISVVALPAGTYIAEVKTAEGVIKKRWLKL